MIKRCFILLPILLMLSACNDKNSVETVRSMVVSTNDQRKLGTVLDARPICEKTTWTLSDLPDGSTRVNYQCDMSVGLYQAMFTQQMDIWKDQHKRILAEAVIGHTALKAAALEKKNQEPMLLVTARALFEKLEASGDLARYKTLVKHAPVNNQNLEVVNTFFASEKGRAWLDTQPDPDTDRAVIKAVMQAVAKSGLAISSTSIDLCTTPAMLVLAAVLSPSEVKKGLMECDITAEARYKADLTSADAKIADAIARLKKVDKTFTLTGVTEFINWTVPVKGTPLLTRHTLVLRVNDGETPLRTTHVMGITDNSMAATMAGDFNHDYQNSLVSAMGDLVR